MGTLLNFVPRREPLNSANFVPGEISLWELQPPERMALPPEDKRGLWRRGRDFARRRPIASALIIAASTEITWTSARFATGGVEAARADYDTLAFFIKYYPKAAFAYIAAGIALYALEVGILARLFKGKKPNSPGP